MAKAQANQAVYKRMAGKLGAADNGSGMISPNSNVPGGSYPRKQAVTNEQAKPPIAVKATVPGNKYNRRTAMSPGVAARAGAVSPGEAGASYKRKTAKTTSSKGSLPTAPSGSKPIKNLKGVD